MSVVNPYNTPVTLAELLTQIAGLAEKTDGIYNDDLVEKLVPLSKTLKDNMPPVIRRPGEVVQYSNYGYTLIGHLVEAVSGESFDKYVQNHIFKPLDMNNAIYSLTPAMTDLASKGYVYENNQWIAQPQGSILVYPAGSIFASAGDMSKFLLVHLQNGQLGNQSILKVKRLKVCVSAILQFILLCRVMATIFMKIIKIRILFYMTETRIPLRVN